MEIRLFCYPVSDLHIDMGCYWFSWLSILIISLSYCCVLDQAFPVVFMDIWICCASSPDFEAEVLFLRFGYVLDLINLQMIKLSYMILSF